MKDFRGCYYDRLDAILGAKEENGTFIIERERFCATTLYRLYKVSNEPENKQVIKF